MPACAATIVLITGMSGSGKTTTLDVLRRRGWQCIDTDYGDWMVPDADGDLIWDARKIQRLLDAAHAGQRLALAGTVRNQGHFRDRFDAVVLLTAPLPVMLDRVARRTTNPYGSTDAQRDAIRANTRDVLPLLRASAGLELDTSTMTPEEAVDAIEAAVDHHTVRVLREPKGPA